MAEESREQQGREQPGPEPMQVGRFRLGTEEHQRRIATNICLATSWQPAHNNSPVPTSRLVRRVEDPNEPSAPGLNYMPLSLDKVSPLNFWL